MNMLKVKIVDSYKSAPNYRELGGWIGIDLKEAIIVGKGMESGKPTIDLQFTDDKGKHYVAMVSGSILEMLAKAVEGKRLRDEQNLEG